MPESIYKRIELVGSSTVSWEEAAKIAINRAEESIKDLRVAEVVMKDIKIEDDGVFNFRTKLALSFKVIDSME